MATKFATDTYGPALLALLRELGPMPRGIPAMRDRVDALNAAWPDSVTTAANWLARANIAQLAEAYAAHADAPAHRKVSARVRAELKRQRRDQGAFAKEVLIPTGRFSQLLNCYVRWTAAEVEAVATALRLDLRLPVEQVALALPTQAPLAPASLDRYALARAAILIARGHLTAALAAGTLDRVRLALAALEEVA